MAIPDPDVEFILGCIEGDVGDVVVVGDVLRRLEPAVVLQVGGDAGSAEGVVADPVALNRGRVRAIACRSSADSDTPAAEALACQSASSAGDTRAAAVPVRRSAISAPARGFRGASPAARELGRSAGLRGIEGGAKPPLARLQCCTLGRLAYTCLTCLPCAGQTCSRASRALSKLVHRRLQPWAVQISIPLHSGGCFLPRQPWESGRIS